MRQDYFVDNNGVAIHFVVLHQPTTNNTQIPWIMIPGMGNSANEIIEDLRDLSLSIKSTLTCVVVAKATHPIQATP
ncbi:MAG: hypothetical protein IPN94_13210 [Sphingobacteriales bacterium]|nr:hypothetical protein [Sphingobacteriales bacterium]